MIQILRADCKRCMRDRVDGVDQGDYVNCCYRLAQVLHKMQPPPELGSVTAVADDVHTECQLSGATYS